MGSRAYCTAAKALLCEQSVAFIEVDADRDPEAANVMVTRAGGRMVMDTSYINE
jgi:glutaredoxin